MDLKKIAVAVVILSVGVVSFAGTLGETCALNNVTTLCDGTTWTVGARALYLQPVYSNADNVLFLNEQTTGTSDFSTAWGRSDPTWAWGFEVEGAHDFGLGRDMNISWYRVHHRFTIENLVSSNFVSNDLVTNIVSIEPKWDAINVEFGQRMILNELGTLRFHGGLQYARIKTDAETLYTDLSFLSQVDMDENGFGPRIGIDLSYGLDRILEMFPGMRVYGKAATAVLVGPQSFKTNTETQYGEASASSRHTAIVPEVEVKLGAQYARQMMRGIVDFDLGWMWNNYFVAQKNAYTVVSATNNADVYFPNEFNFGLQGLYFGLKWTGDM